MDFELSPKRFLWSLGKPSGIPIRHYINRLIESNDSEVVVFSYKSCGRLFIIARLSLYIIMRKTEYAVFQDIESMEYRLINLIIKLPAKPGV